MTDRVIVRNDGSRVVVRTQGQAGGAALNAHGDIELASTNATNGTLRVLLSSYERAVNPTHYGENIRIRFMNNAGGGTASDAKASIAFQTEAGVSKAWLVAHDYLDYAGNNRHRHFSIETTMDPGGASAGQLYTRMSFPFDVDKCHIKVSDATFSVYQGPIRVFGDTGTNIEVKFGRTDNTLNVWDEPNTKERWAIRADSTSESGSNAGSDFRLVRYSDASSALDAPVCIKRSTGNIGLLGYNPTDLTNGSGVIQIKNCSSAPASNATSGGVLYVESGALKWRGSSGTVTTLGAA